MGIKLQLRKRVKVGYGSSMSITTKRGDDGGTDLMFGKRTAKVDNRIEAIGSLDELHHVLMLSMGVFHATYNIISMTIILW